MTDPAVPVHVPVLLAPVLAAAAGARRAVDATLGDGGHAAALRRRAPRCSGIDRDPAAIAVSRRRLGDARIRYLQAPYARPSRAGAVAALPSRLHPARPGRFVPATGRGGSRIYFPSGRAARHADGRARVRPRPRSSTRRTEAELARVFYEYGDERQARRLARGDRAPPRAPAVRHQRRSRQRDPRHAGAARRAARIRAAVPGGADRGQRRARRPRPRAPGLPRRARAGRPAGGHHLSFRRGPAGEAGVPGVGRALHLPARAAGLHLPGPAARPARAAKADRSRAPTKWRRTRARGARNLRIFQAGDAS